jgi:hypothetical protein
MATIFGTGKLKTKTEPVDVNYHFEDGIYGPTGKVTLTVDGSKIPPAFWHLELSDGTTWTIQCNADGTCDKVADIP